jgi:hypothetical protein
MKPALLVSTCQVQTAHGATRPPGHRVPDLCNHPRSYTPGLLLLPQSSSVHVMPHLPPAHHETSKHDSPNETKVKEKQNGSVSDLNSNLAKSMTHHNQTKEWTTWFLTRFPLIIGGSMPLMTVSMAVITVLHSTEVVHIPHES